MLCTFLCWLVATFEPACVHAFPLVHSLYFQVTLYLASSSDPGLPSCTFVVVYMQQGYLECVAPVATSRLKVFRPTLLNEPAVPWRCSFLYGTGPKVQYDELCDAVNIVTMGQRLDVEAVRGGFLPSKIRIGPTQYAKSEPFNCGDFSGPGSKCKEGKFPPVFFGLRNAGNASVSKMRLGTNTTQMECHALCASVETRTFGSSGLIVSGGFSNGLTLGTMCCSFEASNGECVAYDFPETTTESSGAEEFVATVCTSNYMNTQ